MSTPNHANATAVVDAAIAYGAARYIADEYSGTYSAYSRGTDREHFLELLHILVLYEEVIMDNSSIAVIGHEITALISKINSAAGYRLMNLEPLTTMYQEDLFWIQTAVAQLITSYPDKRKLLTIDVPWAYSGDHHIDAYAFKHLASEYNISEDLIPLAIFSYRGLCYSGFANGLARGREAPVAYFAAPGRICALEHLASAKLLHGIRHAREAYTNLLTWLPLPRSGYQFDSFFPSFMAAHTSALARYVATNSPEEALALTLRLRRSSEAEDARSKWSRQLWNFKSSAVVGKALSQSVSDSVVYGDVHMHIHGSPAE